jgi:hypothetical protein
MTNYEVNPLKKQLKKFKVGERLKCPVDKVYRFLSYFKGQLDLSVPKIEGYLEHEESPKTSKKVRMRASGQVLSRKSTQKLLAVRTLKSKLNLNQESMSRINLMAVGSGDDRVTESDVMPTQEDDDAIPPHQKHEFVNWNQLNPLLNVELQNEELNYFVYTDQSSEEEEGSGSEDSGTD